MPGSTTDSLRRQYTLGNNDYRYGFNGKEGDDEVKGDDNQQDYGMRIYDPRVGRFLSVDPIGREYPELTPYQFASNTPIWAIDLDGLEAYFSNSGSFIGWGKNKSLAAPVIIKVESKEVALELNYVQFLDRAHWIFGEGRGGFADHYAHTMQNGKEWGYHGEGFTEEEMYKAMNDGVRTGKKEFFSGTTGVSTYDDFSKARAGGNGLDPSGLNKLKGATKSIEAVIQEQMGQSTDPTFGATNWLGDERGSDKYENIAKKRVGEALVLAIDSPDGRTHTFFDWRSKSDLDRLGIKRPSREPEVQFIPFKIDSTQLNPMQRDNVPVKMPMKQDPLKTPLRQGPLRQGP